ncbi:zinc finger protein 692-like [Rhinophrynus dorsalis]
MENVVIDFFSYQDVDPGNCVLSGIWDGVDKALGLSSIKAAARREKRRLLDAQRGKCRVRLGCHLDEWCALKEHLGFSLHSQLAKFLLDSYRSTASPTSGAISLISVSLASLHRLVISSHQHGRNCALPPSLLSHVPFAEKRETSVLRWGCRADHHFNWNPQEDNAEERPHESISRRESLLDSPEKEKHRKKPGNFNTLERCKESDERPSEAITNQEILSKIADRQPNVVSSERLWPVVVEGPEIHTTESENFKQLCEGFNIMDKNDCVPSENIEEKTQQKCSVNEDQLESTISQGREPLTPCVDKTLNQSGRSDEILFSAAGIRDPLSECCPHDSRQYEIQQTHPEFFACVNRVQVTTSTNSAMENLQDLHTDKPHRGIQSAEPPQATMRCNPGAAMSSTCQISTPHEMKQTLLTTSDIEEQAQGKTSYPAELRKETVDNEKPPNIYTSSDMCHIEEKSLETIQKQGPCPETSLIMGRESNDEAQKFEDKGHHVGKRGLSRTPNRHRPCVDEELAQICKKRIRKATPNELLLCEIDGCGKIFSKRQYLNYHQKYQHMNQRTFCCPVPDCGRTFNFKKHLKEHEKRHSDRRDFICEFCARAFRSSSNLIIHRRIHTGEKPLQCEFCGFTCRQKASLNWHMKKHDADSFYQFPCDICGQRFEKRDNLSAHRSRKHPALHECASITPSLHELSDTENASEKAPCCKTSPTDNLFRTSLQEVEQRSQQSVEEANIPKILDLTENTNERTEGTSQVSDNVPSEISLVIIL